MSIPRIWGAGFHFGLIEGAVVILITIFDVVG